MKLFFFTAAFFDAAFIGQESPMATAAGDVTQTNTVSNSAAVSGHFTQCITQSNGITNNNANTSIDSTSFTFRDVTQTSTLSNSGAVGGELTQYIIHINGLIHNSRAINFVEKKGMFGDASISLIGPARLGHDTPISIGSTSNVFRDVTQTSTMSNSGAITGDLVQYIIHINGMTTNELRNFADSAGDHKTAEIINQLLRKIVDRMSVNGI